MNAFRLRNSLIGEFSEYVRSFIQIRDERIREFIDSRFSSNFLWPEPLTQLNPTFKPGKTIDALVDEKVLHETCRYIFRRNKTDHPGSGETLQLHQHQEDAIRIAAKKHNYVLTTGTGSGKSLAYIIPIVDSVLREGSGKGIRAIIVYPMNALANSQFNELEKFLLKGFPPEKLPVTFQRYTGQEDDETRNRIISNPPDILLTNYVMLELILTRPREKKLIQSAFDLKFLVLDEMHTYRGRQGADVALLLRRLREILSAPHMQCVGTSATLASKGTWADQQKEVAALAKRLFGNTVMPDDIVGETLERATPILEDGNASHISELKATVKGADDTPFSTFEEYHKNPVARWIEGVFGVMPEPGSDRLIRSRPIPLTGKNGAAQRLAEITGVPVDTCRTHIESTLLAGAIKIKNPRTGFPIFPFRLHQFISRGDTVYATIEDPDQRYLTIHGQLFSPDDRDKLLLPLGFCRECGQEFYSVFKVRDPDTGEEKFIQREVHDRKTPPGHTPALLYVSTEKPWPSDINEVMERIPMDWLEDAGGKKRIRRSKRSRIPSPCKVLPDGTMGEGGIDAALIETPLLFCPNCGVSYSARSKTDFPKLGTLGSEGRSTATTILSSTMVQALHKEIDIPDEAKKLLSFTDNRQDASLQAGHLNDFIEIGLLRGAIYKAALDAGSEGLRDEHISQKVTAAISLDFQDYSADPTVRYGRDAIDRALRNVIGYRVYRDLKRGWRISAPNLEQCGLLEIDYTELDTLVTDNELWNSLHLVLGAASPDTRRIICKTLLDFLRRDLCIQVDYLVPDVQETIKRNSANQLRDPWALDEGERMEYYSTVFPCSRKDIPWDLWKSMRVLTISPRGGFGTFLRSPSTFPDQAPLDMGTTQEVIQALFEGLRTANIIRECVAKGAIADVPGYRINAASLIWRASDGTKAYHDRIRMPNAPETGITPNRFFVELYRDRAFQLRKIHSREHTAQVPSILRQLREKDFGTASLPILFCSPTMELGIDIKDLNAVNMRNVPPTPANYAQRSGRAGRSGQPAMVFTYCTFGSPHDQYFFKHPDLMVSGQVNTPRVDICNEDLIRSHIHAIWLGLSDIDLGNTPADLVETSGEPPSLALLPDVNDRLHNPVSLNKAQERASDVLCAMTESLSFAPWYAEGWLEEVIRGIPQAFEAALERWRYLFRSARKQFDDQNRIIADPARYQDHESAKRLRQEAEAQLKLLTDRQSALQSDFYSYRYFASEGFLPGYNFPRLPLSAFIPGRRAAKDAEEFISRPRFLAISEFGPGALIYHEGARYQVTRVMMPVEENVPGEDLPTTKLVFCSDCGYLHPVITEPGPLVCNQCGHAFEASDIWLNMFRLQNVLTRRRERINCDEEERLRLGYELKTGLRFAERDGRPLYRSARVTEGDDLLMDLKYGDAAVIWRINLGWSRRQNPNERGFWLDVEKRSWARQAIDPDDDETNGVNPARVQRVIPFVQDRRNTLLISFGMELDLNTFATLEAALKRAIQIEYQLEDNELAAEALPSNKDRKLLLIYEAAEGGAGVLRQLVEDTRSWSNIALKALDLCHFDPDTGHDRRKAENAEETCQAACYDCLLSYYNQPDHRYLDRHLAKDILLRLKDAVVEPSPVELPRSAHLEQLKKLCDSNLEKEFLSFLEERSLFLPTHAQRYYEEFKTRPDFTYAGDNPTFIYVDGPPHDYPHRQQRDEEQTAYLRSVGILVVRFHHKADWEKIVRQHPSTFGALP